MTWRGFRLCTVVNYQLASLFISLCLQYLCAFWLSICFLLSALFPACLYLSNLARKLKQMSSRSCFETSELNGDHGSGLELLQISCQLFWFYVIYRSFFFFFFFSVYTFAVDMRMIMILMMQSIYPPIWIQPINLLIDHSSHSFAIYICFVPSFPVHVGHFLSRCVSVSLVLSNSKYTPVFPFFAFPLISLIWLSWHVRYQSLGSGCFAIDLKD